MKWAYVLAGLAFLCFNSARADDSDESGAPSAPRPAQPPSRIPVEYIKLQKARAAAMVAHPELAAEEQRLKTLQKDYDVHAKAARLAHRGVTPAEGKVYWHLRRDFRKKLEAAMVEYDPTVGPIFDSTFPDSDPYHEDTPRSSSSSSSSNQDGNDSQDTTNNAPDDSP